MELIYNMLDACEYHLYKCHCNHKCPRKLSCGNHFIHKQGNGLFAAGNQVVHLCVFSRFMYPAVLCFGIYVVYGVVAKREITLLIPYVLVI